jgi:DNA-binding beta-propeller fold protein YncE
MRHTASILATVAAAGVAALVFAGRTPTVQGQGRQEPRFAAVPSEKGGQDIFGGYEIVPNWPKPLSSLAGHEKWTYGAGQSVFAESPNRVFVLQRGELPNLPRPTTIKLPQLGPNIEFPNFRLPWRDATVASPPGALERDGKVGDDSDVGKDGVDFKWEHCILVVDANGNVTEDWTQWDKMLRRPHAVYISPYDPEKRVWVVDDYRHSIFIFSNDGKRLLQTIGEPNVHAADDKHFYRPTFMAWLPDGTFFVADGYANTRVVKFDKNGKYLMTWGQAGKAGRGAPPETRPGYMNNVHGIAVDPMTRQVFVNDRQNHRVQVFDENGKYLREWSFGPPPSDIHLFIITADRYLWAADRGTSKMLKYDLNGNFLYSWGTWGDFPGGMWGVHGLSTDQEGNFYVAEVDSGRAQKYKPRPGANPAFLVGKPVAAVWK